MLLVLDGDRGVLEGLCPSNTNLPLPLTEGKGIKGIGLINYFIA